MELQGMRLVRFEVSAELIQQVLGMPSDVDIIWVGDWKHPRKFLMVVEGPDFPEVDEEEEEAPLVTPIITETETGRVWDWGIKP